MNNFPKLFFLVLFNFAFLSLKAEWQLAFINDADGFTLVRSGAGTSYGSIATVKQTDLFYCEPASGDWWKVNTMHGEEGFMHKSRIKIINDLPLYTRKKMLISIFKKQELLAAGGSGREEHFENKFAPMLDVFTSYFCKTGDMVLLHRLFDTMWANSGSADERPSFCVGDVFVCMPELVTVVIKKLDKRQREFIVEAIDWGLLNHFNLNEGEPTKNKQYLDLKKKLDKIPTN